MGVCCWLLVGVRCVAGRGGGGRLVPVCALVLCASRAVTATGPPRHWFARGDARQSLSARPLPD